MKLIQSFEKNVSEYLQSFNIPLKDKKILVALSGGADSVTLLLVLLSLGKKLGFSVSALHVNHGIRGEEALRDEKFCIKLCCDKDVELAVYHADIPTMAAERKKSVESCGRDYRYEVLTACCKEKGIDYIATAHNANDNAETVLYNLLRGSGSEGLCGIPKLRDNIIRPLLSTERKEIEAYLNALEQDYVTDGTNIDNCYTRNYIRNVILPACQIVNGDAVNAINRAALAVSEDCAYLNTMAKSVEKGGDLRNVPPALQSRLIKNEYRRLFGGGLEGVHINAVKNTLDSTETKYVALPNDVTAVICRGKLSFDSGEALPVIEEKTLLFGNNEVADGCVSVFVGTYGDGGVRIKKDAVCGSIFVRSRKEGDRICVRKINRSIKKCFIDKKIPPAFRDIIPIICDEKGIIYVPHIGVADRVCPKKGEEYFSVCVTMDERFGLLKDEEK
ncbi:MAG: tRNA lysidine(34) synthetase TilS [Ruminococcaceae bacterium]|nr:tRNA lysidine(34) synthetase TilS [Oscillospiraceae bacterium]